MKSTLVTYKDKYPINTPVFLTDKQKHIPDNILVHKDFWEKV